jgi:hypothetical protein
MPSAATLGRDRRSTPLRPPCTEMRTANVKAAITHRPIQRQTNIEHKRYKDSSQRTVYVKEPQTKCLGSKRGYTGDQAVHDKHLGMDPEAQICTCGLSWFFPGWTYPSSRSLILFASNPSTTCQVIGDKSFFSIHVGNWFQKGTDTSLNIFVTQTTGFLS